MAAPRMAVDGLAGVEVDIRQDITIFLFVDFREKSRSGTAMQHGAPDLRETS